MLSLFFYTVMCEYVKENVCVIQNDICPFVYYCTKINGYKPLKSMPQNCKVKQNTDVPYGYKRAIMSRKGYLYIDMGDFTIKVANPFDDIPLFVKVTTNKNGEYKLKK